MDDPALRIRSITTLMRAIRRHVCPIYAPHSHELDTLEDTTYVNDPLKSLTALATLLVRRDEVTAVAVLRRKPLSLLAVAPQDGEDADEDVRISSSSSFLATRNFRDNEPQNYIPIDQADVRNPIPYLIATW